MSPEDRSRNRSQRDLLNARVDRVIDHNLVSAIADSFLIEHPHLSRRAAERFILAIKRKKRPLSVNRTPKT